MGITCRSPVVFSLTTTDEIPAVFCQFRRLHRFRITIADSLLHPQGRESLVSIGRHLIFARLACAGRERYRRCRLTVRLGSCGAKDRNFAGAGTRTCGGSIITVPAGSTKKLSAATPSENIREPYNTPARIGTGLLVLISARKRPRRRR